MNLDDEENVLKYVQELLTKEGIESSYSVLEIITEKIPMLSVEVGIETINYAVENSMTELKLLFAYGFAKDFYLGDPKCFESVIAQTKKAMHFIESGLGDQIE